MQTENHYTETDLGNVSPNPRGNYDNAAKYEYLDLVTMQGGSYLCLAELGKTITGTAPEPGKTTEHWQCLAMPGDRTPEYTDAHDKVVRLAREVEQNTAKVAEDKQSVAQIETDTRQLKEQTEENARQAENSKDSAAGSARAAKTAEDSVRQAESNVRALVNGFDVHVAEKTTEATQAVATAKDNAVQAVERQETASVQGVKDQTGAYITEQKNLAKQELDNKVNQFELDVNAIKAEVTQEGTKQVGIVQDATTAELTKITEKGTEQTGIVTAEGEKQVQAVQAVAQEIIVDREQIQENKKNVANLRNTKSDGIVEKVKGKTIRINDSSNLPFNNLKVIGNPEQETINIKITGKNLADFKKVKPLYGNNQSYEMLENGYILRRETNNSKRVSEIPVQLKAGKTYTLSYDERVLIGSETVKQYLPETEQYFENVIIPKKNVSKIALYISESSVGAVAEIEVTNIQVEAGNVKTAYEPFKEFQIANIPTKTPIPQETLKILHSNYPTTIITNDAEAEIEVSYVADTKNYTDRKIAEAVTAQTQNIANLLSLMPLSTQAAMIETDTNNILKDMEVQD